MFPVLLSFGPITISTFGFFATLSFVVASFFLWRRLRDDYPEEGILNFTIILTLGAVLGARIVYLISVPDFYLQPLKWFSLRANPGLSPLGALLFGFLVLYFWAKKKSWDFWLVADIVVTAFFWVLVLLEIGQILSTGEKFVFVFFAFSVFLLILSFIFAKVFRKFIWYKSGKPGFVACSSLAIFFAGLSLLEIIFNIGVYWERVGVFILAIVCLGFLYRRSERSPREDALGFLAFCQRKRLQK